MRPALLALLLALAAPARANMADPFQPGDAIGEPSATLAGLRVLHERLWFDLRPLADGHPVLVEAVYTLDNPGPARTVTLVFVAHALAGVGAGIWIDGRPVPFARDDASATAYDHALAEPLGVDRPFWEGADRAGEPIAGLRFEAPLGNGRHEVRVRYRARAATDEPGGPTREHTVAYALAPARRWAAFGRLDVEVRVPEGWAAEASVPLARDGDTLTGAFDGLPADALVLTAQAPAPWGIWPLRLLGLALWGGLCWGGGRAVGGWLGRNGHAGWWALAPSLAIGLVGTVALVVPVLGSYALGDSNAYGYGAAIVIGVVAAPLALLGGLALAQTTALRARRRATA